jgi:hypothetical protein
MSLAAFLAILILRVLDYLGLAVKRRAEALKGDQDIAKQALSDRIDLEKAKTPEEKQRAAHRLIDNSF